MTKFSLNRSLCYNQKRVHCIKCLIDSPTKDFEDLVDIIRPDQLQQFLDGKIDTHSFIYTRCPLCKKYFPHLLKNTFVIKSGTYKHKVAPMCDNCIYSYTKSNSERNIRDYISSFYGGECIENSRDIIPPFELDLYYPEKKIAVEFNGDYWHSLKFKNRGYHYNKFKLCLSNGILLISIFETEWEVNCDKIKSYVKDTFNGKQSELSIDNGLMNNNYPIYNIINHHIGEYIEDYYTRGKDCKIYTCGFSHIN